MADFDWPKYELVPTGFTFDVASPSVSNGRAFSTIENVSKPDDAGFWRITIGPTLFISTRTNQSWLT